MDKVSAIKSFFKGDVQSDLQTLTDFSHDTSLFEVRPEVVVFPKNTEDIKNLVRFAVHLRQQGQNISLTTRSAGTDMSGGPLNSSIIIETTRYMNHIRQIGPDFAVVEPGVYYRDFEKETLKHDLLLPSYPASRELCALGGMMANNSGGEKTLAYGKTENYVEAIKMILLDGNEYTFSKLNMTELQQKMSDSTFESQIYQKIYQLVSQNYDLLQRAKPKVSKNSSGYYLWNVFDKEKGTFDLSKLIVGSQGTLGVITEGKLRLIRPKPYSSMLVIFMNNTDNLAQIINHVLQFRPESFESYDDNTFKVALKLFPEIAKRLKGNIFTLGWDFLPEFAMMVTGGIPKLVLLAEFTADDSNEAHQKALEAQASLKEFHLQTKVTTDDKESKKYWVIRRESFSLLRQHMKGMRTAPFIDDLVVRPEYLPQFLPQLYSILNQYNILYTVAGHMGDGNFHIIPLMDMKNPQSKQIIIELATKVYPLVVQFHGSITGEHNDGMIRTPFLPMVYGPEVYRLFEQTKLTFDPLNIFNPGKKVGGNLAYSMAHVVTTS